MIKCLIAQLIYISQVELRKHMDDGFLKEKKAPSLKRFACELGHGQRVPQSFNMVSYGTPCSVLALLLMNDSSTHFKVVFLFGQFPTPDNGNFLKRKITYVLIIAIILPKSFIGAFNASQSPSSYSIS